MFHKFLILILSINSCTSFVDKNSSPESITKEERDKEYSEYLFHLEDEIMYTMVLNEDLINILSVKHNIPVEDCNTILIDYLFMTKNVKKPSTNQYKIEAIKNFAFEHDISEEQVGNLLYDYVNYRVPKGY